MMLGTRRPRVPIIETIAGNGGRLALSCEECQENGLCPLSRARAAQCIAVPRPLVLRRAQPVDAVAHSRAVLDDLGEPDHGHRVLQLDLAAVDLLQEMHHLIDPPELRVVVLDVAEGDEVLYSKYGGTEIKVDGEELLVLRESDVLAKVQ